MSRYLNRFVVVHRLAERQRGFITKVQLNELGVPSATVSRWTSDGLLVRIQHGIYRTRPGVLDFDDTLMLARLTMSDQHAISHRTALELWGLPGARRTKPTILGPHGSKSSSRFVSIRQTRSLNSVDLAMCDGIRVTTPLRSLIDSCEALDEATIGAVLSEAVRAGHFEYTDIPLRIAELGSRGRRGLGKLRRVVLSRTETDRFLNSYEQLAHRVVASGGFPRPVPQFRLSIGGKTFFVDFAWPDYRVIMECDSMLAHSSPEQLQADLARQNLILGSGWTVLRFTYWDIHDRPAEVMRTLAQFLPQSEAQLYVP